jgi:poly-gamma-glutamate synthesis protein (capsule biosynthesis protein)
MYLVRLDPGTGRLVGARLVPVRARRFRLCHAPAEDAAWLYGLLNRLGGPFGTRVRWRPDGSLDLTWR